MPNHSHPYLAHLSGVKKNLLRTVEAPALQAVATPGIPDAYLYSASPGEVHHY